VAPPRRSRVPFSGGLAHSDIGSWRGGVGCRRGADSRRVSLFGAAITGAAIGSAVGSIAGRFVDQALLGPLASGSGQTGIAQGPRLFDLKLGASSEGAVLPRVYGRARLPGQLIWATRFKEEVKVTTQTAGGGQAGSGSGNRVSKAK
jgi:hypothetical protein